MILIQSQSKPEQTHLYAERVHLVENKTAAGRRREGEGNRGKERKGGGIVFRRLGGAVKHDSFYSFALARSLSKVLSSDRGLGLEDRTRTAVSGSLKTLVLKITYIEAKIHQIWLSCE